MLTEYWQTHYDSSRKKKKEKRKKRKKEKGERETSASKIAKGIAIN